MQPPPLWLLQRDERKFRERNTFILLVFSFKNCYSNSYAPQGAGRLAGALFGHGYCLFAFSEFPSQRESSGISAQECINAHDEFKESLF